MSAARILPSLKRYFRTRRVLLAFNDLLEEFQSDRDVGTRDEHRGRGLGMALLKEEPMNTRIADRRE